MAKTARIDVPCRKATDALRAAHVCQLIANDHGVPTVVALYKETAVWLKPDAVMAYER